jgi:Cu+-exporting ATPase
MTCANCSNAIEKHLNSVTGIKSISVSLVTNKATVEADTDIIGPRKIIEEIEDIGFEAEL